MNYIGNKENCWGESWDVRCYPCWRILVVEMEGIMLLLIIETNRSNSRIRV